MGARTVCVACLFLPTGLGCKSRAPDLVTLAESGTGTVSRIVCDEAAWDFGQVLQGDLVTHTFRIRNAGSASVRIERVDPSPSCVAVRPPERIAPGASANLEVTCDTERRQNRLVDKLVLRSDDPASPRLILQVEGRIEPLLALASRTVELKPAFGGTASDEVRLVGRMSTAARLKIESIDPPGPTAELLAADVDKPQGVRLSITGARVGTMAGQVTFSTGLEKPKELTLLYSVHVLGSVSVDPTNPFIDLSAPGSGGVAVHVTSRRRDFRLNAIRMVAGPFEASAERDDAGRGYVVRVVVREDQVPEEQRGLLGTLRLVSNDPAEPQKDVPIFALGTARRSDR